VISPITFPAARPLSTSRCQEAISYYSRTGVSDELDYHRLVNECCRLLDAGGDIPARLVQTARRLGTSRIFVHRSRGGGAHRVRASVIACTDDRAIRGAPALGALPMWVLVVSLVVFVRLYLLAGRPWLTWSVCGGCAPDRFLRNRGLQ